MKQQNGSFLKCVIYLKKSAETVRMEVSFFKPSNALVSFFDPKKELIHMQELNKNQDLEEVALMVEEPASGMYYIEVTNGFYHQGKEIRLV